MNNIDITKNNDNADYNKAIMIIIIVKIKIIAIIIITLEIIKVGTQT